MTPNDKAIGVKKAREAALADVGKRPVVQHVPAGKGVILCPVCRQGLLRYQVSSGGKVRGVCETTGCVSWIE